ncbi:MAG: hypothetical protein AVDCRST_MAG93-647 [uncultured Chloroflexia bacterium]|uniref:Uncharacterized protein n=1 Tax=uncultured Chloroflexia bacterium TaxID=1672391 RepID=A0A6J4HIC1_9CHLR|nr:MAG: hypothetical protein AVDCRST_MAG93-647 [uncultured Chloroflexia bacterium]
MPSEATSHLPSGLFRQFRKVNSTNFGFIGFSEVRPQDRA